MTLTDDSDRLVRVMVSNVSEVRLEQIKQALEGEPDILLVGEAENQMDLLLKAGEQIDVVLLGATQTRPLPAIGTHLLSEYPNLRILVLESGGEAASIYWLGLRCRSIGQISNRKLITTLRRLKTLNPTN